MDYSFTKTIEEGEGYALALSRNGHPIASAVVTLNEQGDVVAVAIKGVWSTGTFTLRATGTKEENDFVPPFILEADLRAYLISKFRRWLTSVRLQEITDGA